jgi:uncharacterized protein (TIGR03435 family)
MVEIVGTRVTASAMDLLGLVQYAYALQGYQVSGGPTRGDRYDILAKPEGGAPPSKEQARQMLQNLLADRFHLTFHRETRVLPVYALVVGKNGPKLQESVKPGSPRGHIGAAYNMQMTMSNSTMELLAGDLSKWGEMGRPVLDQTGLAGTYDYKLAWLGQNAPPGFESDLPSLSIAVRDQLGLRLVSQEAPIDVLVIDSVEKPSEN